MKNQWRQLTAFVAVWVFALSMMSNCYCSPSVFSVHNKQVPSHCHQTASQEKSNECSPRFQADSFENITLTTKAVESPAVSDLVIDHDVDFVSDQFLTLNVRIESPPVSPPSKFFVLHHAFLI